MIDRTPQKTFLKSPAIRVQTPKQGNLNSPARVKRLLSFMELDNDLEDQNAQDEEAEPIESPSEVVKPVKRCLTQKNRPKEPVFEEPEQDDEEDVSMAVEDVGGYDDDGGNGGFGDDSYGQYEGDEQQEDLAGDLDDDEEELEEEEIYEKPATPPVKRTKGTLKASKPAKKPAGPHSKPQVQEHYYEEEYYNEEVEEEEEEDIYGQPPSPPAQPKSHARASKSKK